MGGNVGQTLFHHAESTCGPCHMPGQNHRTTGCTGLQTHHGTWPPFPLLGHTKCQEGNPVPWASPPYGLCLVVDPTVLRDKFGLTFFGPLSWLMHLANHPHRRGWHKVKKVNHRCLKEDVNNHLPRHDSAHPSGKPHELNASSLKLPLIWKCRCIEARVPAQARSMAERNSYQCTTVHNYHMSTIMPLRGRQIKPADIETSFWMPAAVCPSHGLVFGPFENLHLVH